MSENREIKERPGRYLFPSTSFFSFEKNHDISENHFKTKFEELIFSEDKIKCIQNIFSALIFISLTIS